MVRLSFLILVLCSINTTRADFIPKKLYNVVLTAKHVVSGEIVCVDDSVFEMRIEQSSGEIDKILTIRKFKDWICHKRWTKYHIGQQLMVFLNEDEEGYYPIGSGNEGELPIIGNTVYLNYTTIPNSFGHYIALKSKPEFVNYDSGAYLGYPLKLEFLWSYVLNLRNCITYQIGDFNKITSTNFTCSLEIQNTLQNEHKLYKWTFETILKQNQ